MGPIKVPGLDGLPSIFFQSGWSIVKEKVVELTEKFFTSEAFTEGVNGMNLVLIPKKKECQSPIDFSLTALCNIIYKVVAKILANKLRPLLASCIFPHLTAFVPRRQILDNIVVAQKLNHSISSKG